MNYYIKGEHPAEWVVEKLRELGVKEINIPVSITGTGKWFYCVVGDDYELICSEAVKATIEASPDWEEVKPAEPKFKLGDIVLDPFMGSGTTAIACLREQRNFIGCEINTDYFRLATERLKQEQLTLQFEE